MKEDVFYVCLCEKVCVPKTIKGLKGFSIARSKPKD